MENPIKMDDLGGKPLFLEIPVLMYIALEIWSVFFPEGPRVSNTYIFRTFYIQEIPLIFQLAMCFKRVWRGTYMTGNPNKRFFFPPPYSCWVWMDEFWSKYSFVALKTRPENQLKNVANSGNTSAMASCFSNKILNCRNSTIAAKPRTVRCSQHFMVSRFRIFPYPVVQLWNRKMERSGCGESSMKYWNPSKNGWFNTIYKYDQICCPNLVP